MKRFTLPSLATSWQVVSSLAIISAILGLLLFTRLDVLTDGYSSAEVASYSASNSLSKIVDNPINAPYKLVVYGIDTISNSGLLSTRLAAGFFGILTIGLFYFGVRHWHSARVALLATMLLTTSAWFLYTARLGTPDILMPLTVLLFATAGLWLASTSQSAFGYILAVLGLSLAMFVPGALWLVLLGLIIRRNRDIRTIRDVLSWPQIALLVLAVLILVIAPLMYSVIRDPSLIQPLLGLPSTLPDPVEFLKRLAFVPLSILFLSGAQTDFWIARLPLLDIFSSLLFVLGIYYYFKFRSLNRAKMLAGFLVVAGLLIALNNSIPMSLLLPAVYVAVAGGIALLVGQWNTVFPRNPLAQSVGISIIAVAVIVSAVFNMRAYFIAWPQIPETEQNFTQTSRDLIQ